MNKVSNSLKAAGCFLLAAALTAGSLPLSVLASDGADASTIRISSLADWKELVADCHEDSWSVGKTVVLMTDISLIEEGEADQDSSEDDSVDLSDATLSLASFGGVLDGQGHTIRTGNIKEAGSTLGLIRTVESAGVVRNLDVTGTVAPSGAQEKVGGIAGVNKGTLENVGFTGIVEGDSSVGAIAGVNEGTIRDAHTGGTVTGTTHTGGIAGKNDGTITSSTNGADVNTSYKDTALTEQEIENKLESIERTGRLNAAENATVRTNTGGVAGFSDGVISNCRNRGTVGYEKVGYNTGGIAGCSSGFIRDCANRGAVLGRKDVGGIVGQQEPQLNLTFDNSSVDSVQTEVTKLRSLLKDASENTSDFSASVRDYMNGIKTNADAAGDSLSTISGEVSADISDAESKINAAGDAAKSALTTASTAVSEIGQYGDTVRAEVEKLGADLTNLMASASLTDEEKASVQSSYNELKNLSDQIAAAKGTLNEVLGNTALSDEEKTQQIKNTVDSLSQSISDISSQNNAILEILQNADASSEDKAAAAETVQSIKTQMETLASARNSLNTYLSAIITAAQNGEDPSAIQEQLQSALSEAEVLKDGLSSLKTSSDTLKGQLSALAPSLSAEDIAAMNTAVQSIGETLSALPDKAQSLADTISGAADDYEQIASHLDQLSEGVQSLSDIGNSIEAVTSSAQTLADLLKAKLNDTGTVASDAEGLAEAAANVPDLSSALSGILNSAASLDLSLDGPSDTLKTAENDLYSSLSGISDQLSGLDGALAEESGQAAATISAVSDQFDTVIDALMHAVNEAQTSATTAPTYEDISDQDVDAARNGRTTNCENAGAVSADLNVGGIVGTMAVEYDLDPEADIKKTGNSSINYVFKAKDIVDHCKNEGTVTAGNNDAGGVAGRIEIGLIDHGENYALIKGADYTGGVAGYSTGDIRSSYEKSVVSGAKYVGGIAGYASDLTDNLAMTEVRAEGQYRGALAGTVADLTDGSVSGNRYLSDNTYGIDGVSRKGIAESISYEELSALKDLPEEFQKMKLNFIADGVTVRVLSVSYGSHVSADDIPDVPEKKGYVASWDRTDFSSVTFDGDINAVYTRKSVVISGEEQRDGGASVVLADGRFTEGQTLTVTKEATEGAETERWKVTLPDDGEKTHTIRYLAPDSRTDRTRIWLIKEDGSREIVATKESGRYMTFEASGSTVTFAAKTREGLSPFLYAGAGAAAVVLAVIAAALRKRKHGGK